MANKKCSKCGLSKATSEFYKRSSGNSLHSICKACERLLAKVWYESNKEKAIENYKTWRSKNRDRVVEYRRSNRKRIYLRELARKHAIPIGWFDSQMERQSGQCAICKCKMEFGRKKTAPHVDHCHNTGVVREILCNRCNSIVGLCDENAEIVAALGRYIRKWRGTSAKP